MKVTVKNRGYWKKTTAYLENLAASDKKTVRVLEKYGKKGVDALSKNTPVDTGKTASSWRYSIDKTQYGYSLKWYNDNLTHNGIPIVILLQYGHATGTGGYVEGIDFINPTLKPIFDEIATDVVKELR
jgi:hypothetical protein